MGTSKHVKSCEEVRPSAFQGQLRRHLTTAEDQALERSVPSRQVFLIPRRHGNALKADICFVEESDLPEFHCQGLSYSPAR